MEHPFVLGTAGHIDHGKTALVKALSGIDCDRLEEEKRRGITIELGFAPLVLASGRTVSIIDVPGHERFIRQMAAGASGMDAAMLVVAASEGVMPQTREHLDILNLLGVRSGLVVLTKKDLVDGETLEIAMAEVADLISGSCLAGAKLIPVSALSGEGIPEVLTEIERIIDTVPPRKGFGAFFLPVDRAFSKEGFGSVVTGTVSRGSVAEGEEVQVMPSGALARVRSLQTHGTKVGGIRPGQRVAINLSGLSGEPPERGDSVCAKGAFLSTDCIGAWLQVLPAAGGAASGVSHWQRVRLHVGTVDVVARISLLKPGEEGDRRNQPPGSSGPVQILPESKIAVAAGQHFVIRLYSPLITIGGGRILLPNARPAGNRAERQEKARLLAACAEDFRPSSFLAALVHDRGLLDSAGLFALSQMDRAGFTESVALLAGQATIHRIVEFGKSRAFIAAAAFDAVAGAVRAILKKFHADNPELSGLEPDKLYSALEAVKGGSDVSQADFKSLITIMEEKGIIAGIELQGRSLCRAVDFNHAPDDRFTALADRVRRAIDGAGFNLLTVPDLEAGLKLAPAELKRALSFLREREDLRIIEGGLLFSRTVRRNLIDRLAGMSGDITVASLRDAIGVSRKYTMPMLEFLDSQGITRREGDRRILQKDG